MAESNQTLMNNKLLNLITKTLKPLRYINNLCYILFLSSAEGSVILYSNFTV